MEAPRGGLSVSGENPDGDECLPTDKSSPSSLLTYHSQLNELFIPHASNTQRPGSHLCLFTPPLGHFPPPPPPPPESPPTLLARSTTKDKHVPDGEEGPVKRSPDRCLLAALMGFQHRKGVFNQPLEWPCRGSAPESASLARPRYSIPPVKIR